MDPNYLYDEGGEAVAFMTDDRMVWSPSSRFLGWFPLTNEPDIIVDIDGSYFGEVIDGRLCRRSSPPYISSPGRRAEPLQPHVSWGHPPMGSRSMLPSNYEDIPRSLLA